MNVLFYTRVARVILIISVALKEIRNHVIKNIFIYIFYF